MKILLLATSSPPIVQLGELNVIHPAPTLLVSKNFAPVEFPAQMKAGSVLFSKPPTKESGYWPTGKVELDAKRFPLQETAPAPFVAICDVKHSKKRQCSSTTAPDVARFRVKKPSFPMPTKSTYVSISEFGVPVNP